MTSGTKQKTGSSRKEILVEEFRAYSTQTPDAIARKWAKSFAKVSRTIQSEPVKAHVHKSSHSRRPKRTRGRYEADVRDVVENTEVSYWASSNVQNFSYSEHYDAKVKNSRYCPREPNERRYGRSMGERVRDENGTVEQETSYRHTKDEEPSQILNQVLVIGQRNNVPSYLIRESQEWSLHAIEQVRFFVRTACMTRAKRRVCVINCAKLKWGDIGWITIIPTMRCWCCTRLIVAYPQAY
ncbi:hypothetical protein CBL_07920 [Carabus blaptoides fortunei]